MTDLRPSPDRGPAEATRGPEGAAPRDLRTRPAAATLLAALLAGLLAGCVKSPVLELTGVGVEGVDFKKVDLAFELRATNPNGFRIHLTGVTYVLESEGTEFARGEMRRPMTLPANQATTVRAPISVYYLDLLPVLRRARGAESVPYQLKADAKFRFLGIGIPVRLKRSGKMPALRNPGWHLRDVQLVRGPPSWLELSFEVDNPNAFELPLEQLRGVLKYGDDVVVRIDEPKLGLVPPGKSKVFSVRARADGRGVARAFARRLLRGQRQKFTFDGDLRVGVPALLRKMFAQGQRGDG
ncbi:hypothetical protein LCGC14_2161240 [marine sediment metagenome]|uniref:Water stress and hypersensitive response domain-containing protein n=1 Tax=marine sediment metagenome TaxID=412755 RepID=A0A0F9DSM6_9ZZZZ